MDKKLNKILKNYIQYFEEIITYVDEYRYL